jgi:hypothetical protein
MALLLSSIENLSSRVATLTVAIAMVGENTKDRF